MTRGWINYFGVCTTSR
ncbi:hypothetical protein K9F02_12310 [Staphylococcus pseudintermedius]|nr:hypothetical protein [Staphylococcus pseudintermedius]MDA3118173.1 hypothetical protein [Staphylococcus pseudintermedius]USE05302.1 hypothetical protein K9F02_12310 [Staphylococcus pseudintermedius]